VCGQYSDWGKDGVLEEQKEEREHGVRERGKEKRIGKKMKK
jgi:hypothetical protein